MELLRTWEADGFRLELYYNGTGWGRVRLAYKLFDASELIFDGDDFYPSLLYSFDGDEAIAALLGFLSLRPGDTDCKQFDEYTPRQLAWADCRPEALSIAARK